MLKRLVTHWPVLALLALPVALFHKLVFSGMILGRGDVYLYFYPYWAVRDAAMRAGQLPLWSPDVFMGAPLLANSQLGTFYPPNWLTIAFDPPAAITISLLIHTAWAGIGVYLLARRALGLEAIPALLAGVLFAAGGHLSAQTEHINQFQALSWMPLLFLLYDRCLAGYGMRAGMLLAAGIALQALAGHPQTVFITLVGLAVYGVGRNPHPPSTSPSWRGGGEPDEGGRITMRPYEGEAERQNDRWARGLRPLSGRLWRVGRRLAWLGAVVPALLLAAPQIVPTLELTAFSNRGGGLNPQQAMAFSLNPLIVGRGLLPSYDGLVFGEYMAYLGVIGLGLAVLGALSGRAGRGVWIALGLVGLGLALGAYNPLYWTLAGLPGFSFFRVPARWLALFALAAALLAGMGLSALQQRRPGWRSLIAALLVIGGLGAGSFLAGRVPEDVTGSAVPTIRSLTGWAVAGLALLAGALFTAQLDPRWRLVPVALAAGLELFFASRIMAYNELVPPDVFSAPRFTISQLQAYARQQTPPGRYLSISPLEFDPGDVAALTARYAGLGMSDLAIRFALVDTKLREVVSPNLSLTWGLSAVDGFDGGLLPTSYYSAFTRLLLPAGAMPTTDGRLREMLALPECRGACIPDFRWLNLTNMRYLIVDKVYDLWHEGVAYDTTFEVMVEPGAAFSPPVDPAFVANAVDVLYAGEAALTTRVNGDDLLADAPVPLDAPGWEGFQIARFRLDEAQNISELAIRADDTAHIRALTLVDSRVPEVFLQQTIWPRVLSSDIKLYQNPDVMGRAFVVHEAVNVPDTPDGTALALEVMRDAAFDPRQTVVLAGADEAVSEGSVSGATATITDYTAERVEIAVDSPGVGYLVLTDAFYPGWTAAVNGDPATILRADVMFRAVRIPAGASTVVFAYRPAWWPGALLAGLGGWLALAAVYAVLTVERRRRDSPN